MKYLYNPYHPIYIKAYKQINKKIPDIKFVIGLAPSINLEKIKTNYKSKIALWYEDALGYKGNGPNWEQNLSLIEKNNDLIDSYFTTTHPDAIKSKIKKKN